MEKLEIEVKNFGPIVEAKVALRPLTLFIGPSNSGKSYLSTLIYALHRAMNKEHEHAFERKRSSWKFSNEQFSELENWFNKNFEKPKERSLIRRASSTRSNLTFTGENFELPKKISKLIRTTLRANSKFGAEALKSEIERCFGAASIQSLIRRTGSQRQSSSAKTTVAIKKSNDDGQNYSESFTYNFELSAENANCSVDVSEKMPLCIWGPDQDVRIADIYNFQDTREVNRLFRHRVISDKNRTAYLHQRIRTNLINAVVSNSIDPLGKIIHYLPADRTGVVRAHQIIVSAMTKHTMRAGIDRLPDVPILSGVLGDFLDQLLGINSRSFFFRRRTMFSDREQRSLLTKAARHLEQEVLKGTIKTKGPNGSVTSYPIFSYTPSRWKNSLPLMHASSMVSELSPLVLYLQRVVAPGDVLIIEEPEAHLHPDLQLKFVKVLAEIVKAGVQVIVTTHSSLVLAAVANLIFSKEAGEQNNSDSGIRLSKQDVGLWSFVEKNRPKGTVVEQIEFDCAAGGFPARLDDPAMELHNEWAAIANSISENS